MLFTKNNMVNKKFFLILSFVLTVLIFSPALVSARIEIPNPIEADTFQELIYNIIDFLFALAIPLATLMIIVSAFYFVTAAGNPEQITTAKNIILWTLIGFLVILMAKGLVWFLMEVVFQAERPR